MAELKIQHVLRAADGSGAIRPARKHVIYALVILVTTAIVLSPSLFCGFVDWDDPRYLLENANLAHIGKSWDWASIWKIFTSDIGGNYNPLPIVTYAIEKYFFAPDPAANPFVFHFDNLLLHVICTLLVFTIFLKLNISTRAAFIGALLFGIHPMRVESVTWITERKDVLYGMFYMAAIVCYLNYLKQDGDKRRWFLAAVSFAILSCFSKVQAVPLPVSLAAIDNFTGRKWMRPKYFIVEKLPFWLCSGTVGIINLRFLYFGKQFSSAPQLTNYRFIDKLAVGAYAYFHYLVKCIWPYKMTHYYEYPAHMPTIAYFLIVLVPVSAITFVVWAKRRNYQHLVLGFVLFTANVVFMLQVLPAGFAFMADRFTYVAYTGPFFILAYSYQDLLRKRPRIAPTVNGILAVYICMLAITTYRQAGFWKNSVALYKHNIDCYPNCYYGYNQLGVWYLKEAFDKETSQPKNIALLKPALANFAVARKLDSANGRPVPSISSEIMQNLGIAKGLAGEADDAISAFSEAVKLDPANDEAYKNRGYHYFLNHRFSEAITDYTAAIKMDSADGELYYMRANCYFSTGNMTAARSDIEQAIAINDHNANYYIARSVISRSQGFIPEAREDAKRARDLGGKVPDIYLN